MPSAETCSATISGRASVQCSGQPVEHRAGDIAHRRELAGAAMVDPVPELGAAHLELALGRADFGERVGMICARVAPARRTGALSSAFRAAAVMSRLLARGYVADQHPMAAGRQTGRARSHPPNTSLVCAVTRTKVVRFVTSLRWAAPM